MWNASRCALFGPMPGRRCSSSMRRTSGSGSDTSDYRLQISEFHAGREHATHLLGHLFIRFAMRVIDRGDDHILQHLDLFLRDHFRIDLEGLNLLRAIDGDGDHAAAGVALDAQFGHLLLQALLHLLRLLHHLLDVHISSTSRISAGKTSSIACTPASAIACSRSTDFRSAVSFALAGTAGLSLAGATSLCTLTTAIFRPDTCCAADSIHARFCSKTSRSVRWFGEKVKVTRSPATSIFCACATTVL